MAEPLMTAAQVLDALGISGRTLARMIDAGTLTPVRPTGPRGHRKFRARDVERLLNTGRPR